MTPVTPSRLQPQADELPGEDPDVEEETSVEEEVIKEETEEEESDTLLKIIFL